MFKFKVYKEEDYYEDGYITTPELDTEPLMWAAIFLPLAAMTATLVLGMF